MRHLGALVAITVLVFGTIFLLTSDWPFGGPAEQAPSAGETAMLAGENPAPEEAAPAQPAAQEQPADEPEGGEVTAEAGAEAAVAEEAAGDDGAEEQTAAAEAEAAAEPAQEAAEGEAAPADEAPEEAAAETEAAAPNEGAPAEVAAAQDAEPAAGGEAAAETDVAALMADGQGTYEQICQACHGARGEGAVGPAFAGNANLEDASYVAATIIHGREAMPPFGEQLDDAQIAAVATFIRNSWGNELGPVTADAVAAER